MLNLKKLAKFKIHGFISAIILISIFLFSSYQIGVKAMGSVVLCGSISAQLPMSTCTQYEYDVCEVCSLCGCGEWDQDIIAPRFGTNSNSEFYACKMPAYTPQGTGSMDVGTIVCGYCPDTTLSAWSTSCNLWTQSSSVAFVKNKIAALLK